jgi:hypothetical protein
MSLLVASGSLGAFHFQDAYGRFLHRRVRIYGMWFVTPHALLHVVSFSLLGFLASLISGRWPIRVVGICGLLLLGVAIEWAQYELHPPNAFEIWDLLTDAFGICLGVFLGHLRSGNRPFGAMLTV